MSLSALHSIFTTAFLLVSSEEYIGEIAIEVGNTFVMHSGDIIKSQDQTIILELQNDDLVLSHAISASVLWSLRDDGGISVCSECITTIEITSTGEIRIMDDDTLTSALGIHGESSPYSFHVCNDGYMYLQCDEFVTSFVETLVSDPIVVWIAGDYRTRSGRSQSHSFLHSISTTESQDFEFVEGDAIYSLNGRTKLVADDHLGLALFNANNEMPWSNSLPVYSNAQECFIVIYPTVETYYDCDTSLSFEGSIFVSSQTIDSYSFTESHDADSYSLIVSNNIFYIENSAGERIFYSDTIDCNECVFDGSEIESVLCYNCSDSSYSQSSIHYKQTDDASSCSLNLPELSVHMDTYDTIQGVGNIAIAVVGVASLVVSPLAGIGAVLSTAFAVADFAGAGHSNGLTDEQMFETIGDLFTESWQCTTDYVDQQLEQLRSELFETWILGTAKQSMQTVDDYLNDLQNYETPAQQYDQFVEPTGLGAQLDKVILPSVFNLPEDGEDRGRDCRALIPFIHLAMHQRMIVMSVYIHLSHFADDIDWDSEGFTVKDLYYANDFLLRNIDFMELYLNCVGFAYFDILTASDTLKLSQIKNEIDLLFDGEMFCSWIEISEAWGHLDSVDDWVSTSDFTVFADCDPQMLTEHMLSSSGLVEGVIYNSAKALSVTDLFDGGDTVTPYNTRVHEELVTTTHGTARTCDESGWTVYDIQPCDNSAINTDGEIMLYFGQLTADGEQRTLWMKNADTGCNSDCGISNNDIEWSRRERAFSCPNDRRLRGARYIVESDSNMRTIAGLEILCTSNTSNGVQDDWTSKISLGFDDALVMQYDYEWSPWKICPKDSYLSLRIEGMECKSKKKTEGEYRYSYGEQVLDCTDIFVDFLNGENSHVVFECTKGGYEEIDEDFYDEFESGSMDLGNQCYLLIGLIFIFVFIE